MTAIDYGAVRGADTTAKPRRPRFLRMILAQFRRKRRVIRTYLELSRLDERLLYDLGIDPIDVRDALNDHSTTSILFEPMRRQFDFGDKPGKRKS